MSSNGFVIKDTGVTAEALSNVQTDVGFLNSVFGSPVIANLRYDSGTANFIQVGGTGAVNLGTISTSFSSFSSLTISIDSSSLITAPNALTTQVTLNDSYIANYIHAGQDNNGPSDIRVVLCSLGFGAEISYDGANFVVTKSSTSIDHITSAVWSTDHLLITHSRILGNPEGFAVTTAEGSPYQIRVDNGSGSTTTTTIYFYDAVTGVQATTPATDMRFFISYTGEVSIDSQAVWETIGHATSSISLFTLFQ